MSTPSILNDVASLLLALAFPAAICTLLLVGLALRQEGGVNFSSGGRFQKWMLWSAILLTVPQSLSWIGAHGVMIPASAGTVQSPWLSSVEKGIQGFVTDVVVTRLIPILAAFLMLKAVLDLSQGENPLGSVIAALFVLTVASTAQLMRGWNSGSQFALTDMLGSLWTYAAGRVLPAAAGLAIVGAIVNYMRQRPILPLVFSALAFLSLSGLWKLAEAWVG